MKREDLIEAVLNKVGDVSPKMLAQIEVMAYANRSLKDIVKAVKAQ